MDLSIIIPVFNAELFLTKCLNTIYDQKNFNFSFEIIAINDGSTDNSLAILKEFQQKNSNFIVIEKTNGGSGSARNAGLDVAKAKYIWFVDADDFLELNAFENLQNFLFSDNESKTIGFNYFKVNQNNLKTTVNTYDNQSETQFFKGLEYITSNKPYFLWVMIYENDIIKNNKIRFIENIKNIEDLEFSIRYFSYAQTIIYHNVRLYNYFENSNSTSRSRTRENILKLAFDTIVVHKSLKQFLLKNFLTVKDKNNINFVLETSIMGFFYSLLIYNYTESEVKEYYFNYFENKFLPIKLKTSNFKFYIFKTIINIKFLFYLILKIKKKYFLK